MLSLERYIEQIKELQIRTAHESLNPAEGQKTEFNFGYVCGIKAGLDLALSKLEAEPTEEGNGKNPLSRNR